jgi:hypothetical protein
MGELLIDRLRAKVGLTFVLEDGSILVPKPHWHPYLWRPAGAS